MFIFTPKIGEDEPILTSIFVKWVGSTTKPVEAFFSFWSFFCSKGGTVIIEDGKNPDCQIHVPPEAIHGLLMCSERIAQEENFNGGHMTLEEGAFFRMGKWCSSRNWMKWIDKVIFEQEIFRCDASSGNLRVPTHPKKEIAGPLKGS